MAQWKFIFKQASWADKKSRGCCYYMIVNIAVMYCAKWRSWNTRKDLNDQSYLSWLDWKAEMYYPMHYHGHTSVCREQNRGKYFVFSECSQRVIVSIKSPQTSAVFADAHMQTPKKERVQGQHLDSWATLQNHVWNPTYFEVHVSKTRN